MSEDYRDNLLDENKPKRLTHQDAPLWLKIVILVCICSMQLGTYYSSDIPGAIQKQLTEWFKGSYDYDESSNALLYSVYSWPNCVLPLFGGILIDRVLGIRASVMLFVSCIVSGQVLFSLGCASKTYWLCVLGRLVLGLGGESLGVSQNQFCVRWFKGPSLAIIFGIVLAAARIGSSINFVLTPRLAKAGVDVATWTATGIALYSFAACLILVLLDRIYSKFVEHPKTDEEIEKEKTEAPFSIKDITAFPLPAWVLFAICATFYVGVIVFYQVVSVIIQETSYHMSPEDATLMPAIPNFLSIFFSPFFGRIIDRFGYTVYGLMAACTTMIFVQGGFLATAYDVIRIHPAILMVILGIAYAVGATMWTLVPLLVPSNKVSTAYGLMTAIQNVSLSFFPMFISYIQGLDGIEGTLTKYTAPILTFITCQIIAASLSTWLAMIDATALAGRLNLSSAKRSELDAAKEALTAEEVSIP